ncbi:hypothetical protein [Nitrosococcus oceani]|nr:hypothetical protein [Nitrosococcus oceani]EDZ67902.1 hypothetical protein NOC27_1229 [Nitrosococcus oceani AFC27]KFI19976.1 hypothetical protein IB75_05650 [Nitrosococcus oceani C-27]KFI23130.1 hypothetical protein HW44_05540 [Nitrosococcus oceani]
MSNNIISIIIAIARDEVSEDTLKNIDENVKRLIQKHYNVGLRYLEEMHSVSNTELRKKLLHDARRSFSEAITVDTPLQSAQATRIVAVCYDLLDEKETAFLRYEEAFLKAIEYYNRLLKQFESSGGTRGIDLLLGFSLVGQPIMYTRWTLRYFRRKKLEEEAKNIRSFLYDLKYFLVEREIFLQALYSDIESIPPYSWSDTG